MRAFAAFLVVLLLSGCASLEPSTPLAAWSGTWKGELALAAPGAEPRRVTMGLRIAEVPGRPERRTFVLSYDDRGKRDVREYELVLSDLAKGLVKIDERNSIVIDATLRDDTIVSAFVVGGFLTTCRYALRADRLEYTCESIDLDLARGVRTGGEAPAPSVTLPRVVSVQRALLARVAAP